MRSREITDEKYFVASQWQLMRRKLMRHKLAIIGGSVLLFLYFTAIFCEFFSPYDIYTRYPDHIYAGPQKIRIFDGGKLSVRPFVYGLKISRDPVSLRRTYEEDKNVKHYIRFFVHGDPYKLLGFVPTDIHFIGVEEGTLFLFGTDKLGRDLFSRDLHAARDQCQLWHAAPKTNDPGSSPIHIEAAEQRRVPYR